MVYILPHWPQQHKLNHNATTRWFEKIHSAQPKSTTNYTIKHIAVQHLAACYREISKTYFPYAQVLATSMQQLQGTITSAFNTWKLQFTKQGM